MAGSSVVGSLCHENVMVPPFLGVSPPPVELPVVVLLPPHELTTTTSAPTTSATQEPARHGCLHDVPLSASTRS